MGEVIDLASSVRWPSNLQKITPPLKDEEVCSPEEPAKLRTLEELALIRVLTQQGIKVFDAKSSADFELIMCMVKGMRDRQNGHSSTENYLYLETLGLAMRQAKELPEDDGSFDDLLSKL